jgi:tetratricopeptide (TPR) repeat protein
VLALAAVAIVVGAVLVGRSALAEHYREQARDALPENPARALQKTRDSLNLNDEALPTYYVRSAAYARLGRYQPARAALVEATRREPHDFLPWALRGDLAARRGERRQAARDYRRALALNPRDGSLSALAADPPTPGDIARGGGG